MGIVLSEAANPHQAVKLAGLLMTVYDSQLAHPQRQIPVGTGLGRIHQNTAGAVHGLNSIIFFINHRGVHVILIMIPVSGGLPQASV